MTPARHSYDVRQENGSTSDTFADLSDGTAIGAAGTYFAEKYTDKRRQKEHKSEKADTFMSLASRMPDLLSQMKEDLEVPAHSEWREFFVIPKGVILNASGSSFYYEEDDTNGFLSKTRTLEEYGLVYDITPKNAQNFE